MNKKTEQLERQQALSLTLPLQWQRHRAGDYSTQTRFGVLRVQRRDGFLPWRLLMPDRSPGASTRFVSAFTEHETAGDARLCAESWVALQLVCQPQTLREHLARWCAGDRRILTQLEVFLPWLQAQVDGEWPPGISALDQHVARVRLIQLQTLLAIEELAMTGQPEVQGLARAALARPAELPFLADWLEEYQQKQAVDVRLLSEWFLTIQAIQKKETTP